MADVLQNSILEIMLLAGNSIWVNSTEYVIRPIKNKNVILDRNAYKDASSRPFQNAKKARC